MLVHHWLSRASGGSRRATPRRLARYGSVCGRLCGTRRTRPSRRHRRHRPRCLHRARCQNRGHPDDAAAAVRVARAARALVLLRRRLFCHGLRPLILLSVARCASLLALSLVRRAGFAPAVGWHGGAWRPRRRLSLVATSAPQVQTQASAPLHGRDSDSAYKVAGHPRMTRQVAGA